MRRQTLTIRTGFCALLIALVLPLFSTAACGADRVRIALPGNSMGYLPLIVAIHRGFFKEEGLDLELIRLVPTVAHNALLLNEVQYHGLADSGLRLAARGAPLKAIFYGADRPMYYLVGKKDLHTVAELKGKKIGVSTFGGTSDLSARLLLKQHGIDEKNTTLLQFGSEGTRVGALKAGAADAIIVPVPAVAILRTGRLQRTGFRRRRCGFRQQPGLHHHGETHQGELSRSQKSRPVHLPGPPLRPRKIPRKPSKSSRRSGRSKPT